MSNPNIVGQRIRSIRESRQMSVEDLAAAIPGGREDNIRLVSSLEQGDLVPSLTPLLQIARALGVRLGSFLDDQVGHPVVVARGEELTDTSRFIGSNLGGGAPELAFHSLAANKNDRHMEPFLVTVKPHEGSVELSSHEGEEFVHVLEGKIEVVYGKEAFTMGTGDSIYYDSIVPHHLHAAGQENARILAVVYAPY